MTESTDTRNGVKTLGIKLNSSLHAQFVLVAQLDELSLSDASVKAVELYVATKKAEPDFAARAAAVLAEIEQEAASRKAAIQGLFGAGDAETTAAEPEKAKRTK